MQWRKVRFLVEFALESVGVHEYSVGEYGDHFVVTGRNGRAVDFEFVGTLLVVRCREFEMKCGPMAPSKAISLMAGLILAEDVEEAVAEENEENMAMEL